MTGMIWTAVLIVLASVIVFIFMRAARQQQKRYAKLHRRVRRKAYYGWDSLEDETLTREAQPGSEDGSLDTAEDEDVKSV